MGSAKMASHGLDEVGFVHFYPLSIAARISLSLA